MRSFHFEPVNYIGGKARIPLRFEDIMNCDVYDDMWLYNDDKESDVLHLIEQNRLRK